MRLFLTALILIINGAIGHAQTEPPGGNGNGSYTYVIQALRTSQAPMPNSIFNLGYEVEPVQNITYVLGVDKKRPFDIKGIVKMGDNKIYEINKKIHSCDDSYDNSWDYLVAEVIKKQFMPNGTCPVEKDITHQITEEVDPINVTFDSMLLCGDYQLKLHLYWGKFYVLGAIFSFNIPENGDCIHPSRS